MKKLMFMACLLVAAISAKAQFEQGKWFVNPAVTGVEMSHSSAEQNKFGVVAQGGAFLVDDVALILTVGGEWRKHVDVYTVGVGGRYYFHQTGVYVGTGLGMSKWKFDGESNHTDYAINSEVGYAFFLNKSVTIEPAVFYNWSMKDNDYSKFGFKMGFGIYF